MIRSISKFYLTFFILTITGCSTGFQQINYGKDECDYCRMTIMDNRFAAEIVTKKGKAFKFDDLHCAEAYLKAAIAQKKDIRIIYVTDYSMPGEPIDASKANFIRSDGLHSPMGGNIAAFKNGDTMKLYQQKYNATVVSYEQIIP